MQIDKPSSKGAKIEEIREADLPRSVQKEPIWADGFKFFFSFLWLF